MNPDGTNVCFKCDLYMANFKNLENDIRQKHGKLPDSQILGQQSAPNLNVQNANAPTSTPVVNAEISNTNLNATKENKPALKRRYTGSCSFVTGQKIHFYDKEQDEMVVGTIISQAKENVYKIGSKGKILHLNARDITAVAERKD